MQPNPGIIKRAIGKGGHVLSASVDNAFVDLNHVDLGDRRMPTEFPNYSAIPSTNHQGFGEGWQIQSWNLHQCLVVSLLVKVG